MSTQKVQYTPRERETLVKLRTMTYVDWDSIEGVDDLDNFIARQAKKFALILKCLAGLVIGCWILFLIGKSSGSVTLMGIFGILAGVFTFGGIIAIPALLIIGKRYSNIKNDTKSLCAKRRQELQG